jgi:Tfp pilus assembly protein PilV
MKRNGFSIVSVLIAIALMSVVALGVMQLTKMMSTTTKQSEGNTEIVSMQNQIIQLLINRKHCSKSFENKTLPANNTSSISLNVLKRDNGTNPGRTAFDKTTEYGNHTVKISSIKLYGSNAISNNQANVNLEITFEKISKIIKGSKTVTKKFPIFVEVDNATNREIQKCFSMEDDAVITAKNEICDDLGGDFSTGKCVLTDSDTINNQSKKAACEMLGGTFNTQDKKCEGLTIQSITGGSNQQSTTCETPGEEQRRECRFSGNTPPAESIRICQTDGTWRTTQRCSSCDLATEGQRCTGEGYFGVIDCIKRTNPNVHYTRYCRDCDPDQGWCPMSPN